MLKKIATTFLCLAVLLSMNACGSEKPTEETDNSFSIEEYRTIVNNNREDIYNACVYLSNLGEYEHNYWKTHNSLGPEGGMPDTAIDAAFEWLSENSDGTKETVEAAFRDIRQQHKEIVVTVILGPEAQEIHKAYMAMYDAYIDLYNLVTEPSNSINEFVETYNACVNSIKECNQSLSLSLDGYTANSNTSEQAATASKNSSVWEDGIFAEYPGDIGIEIEGIQPNLPAVIYSEKANEYDLEGNLYAIKGIVKSTDTMDEATYYVIETIGGDIGVIDMLCYHTDGKSTVTTEALRSYFPLPLIGEKVIIAAQYLGHSSDKNIAMFIYGGTDYYTDAFLSAALDSVKSNKDTNSTEPSEQTESPTTTTPTENQQDPVAPPEPSLDANKSEALSTANRYLDAIPFSHDGLISQLEYEGYSLADATYAADNCGADWNTQALKKAKNYLDTAPFSYSGLISQLEYEKFTTSQATYAADNCGADWNEQAKKSAANYLSLMAFSRNDLISQLEYEGFTHDQAVYGVEANGL